MMAESPELEVVHALYRSGRDMEEALEAAEFRLRILLLSSDKANRVKALRADMAKMVQTLHSLTFGPW